MTTHTYVECCDRYVLIENTIRFLDHGVSVRLCRNGYGCTYESINN